MNLPIKSILLVLMVMMLFSSAGCAKDPGAIEQKEEPTAEVETPVEETPAEEKDIGVMDESLVMSEEELEEAAKDQKPIIVEIFKEQGADQEIKKTKKFKKTVGDVVYVGVLVNVESKQMYNPGSGNYQLYYRGEMKAVE